MPVWLWICAATSWLLFVSDYVALHGLIRFPGRLAYALFLFVAGSVIIVRMVTSWLRDEHHKVRAYLLAFALILPPVIFNDTGHRIIDIVRLKMDRDRYERVMLENKEASENLMVAYWGGFGFLDAVWSFFLIRDDDVPVAISDRALLARWSARAPRSFGGLFNPRPGRHSLPAETPLALWPLLCR